MKKNSNNSQKIEKFLCFCSKITFARFSKSIADNGTTNLEEVCEKLGLAKKCAACLPNIEDEYYNLSGKKKNILSISQKVEKIPITKKIKNYLDSLCGNSLISQYGFLPMLASEKINTWLVVSNYYPSFLKKLVVPYALIFEIFDKNGTSIKSTRLSLLPNQIIKICLNDYIYGTSESVESYFVKVERKPLAKGLRGSTRPHFFYETQNSMATLHTQDGSHRKRSVILNSTQNKDKNFLFLINPHTKTASVKINYDYYNELGNKIKTYYKTFKLNANGSKLLELITNSINFNKKTTWSIKATISIKSYLVTSDYNFKVISVDHL